MEFNAFIGRVMSGGKRKGVPDQYQKFLPENIKKGRYAYPYSYDSFLIYFNDKAKKEASSTIYTDRLLQWDYAKHNLLCKRHFGNEGQHWNDRDAKKIEQFLCDWTGKKIVLVANIQCVNKSSGYPVWRLDYYEAEKLPDKEKNASMGKTGANNANENSKT